MKIGIITQSLHVNYGGLLQNLLCSRAGAHKARTQGVDHRYQSLRPKD